MSHIHKVKVRQRTAEMTWGETSYTQAKSKKTTFVKLIRDGADLSSSDNRLKLINPKRSVELLITRKQW
jgi:hypothetical protein